MAPLGPLTRIMFVLAAALAVMLGLAAAAHLRTWPDASGAQPPPAMTRTVSAFTPGNGSKCACFRDLEPVCKGRMSWPNECSARCDGVMDATPCLAVMRPW